MKTHIYVLMDEADVIRYVGKAINPRKRYYEHLHDKKSSHKARWVRKELRNGGTILMKIMQVVEGDGNKEERKLIADLKREGIKLANITEGGEGVLGRKHTKKHKLHMSKVMSGRKPSKATRKKQSEWQIGKKLTPECKEKLRKAFTGRVITWGDKITKALTGRKLSRTHVANMKKAITGRKLSEEHRRHISEGNMGNKRTPESIEKAVRNRREKSGYRWKKKSKLKMSLSRRGIPWTEARREADRLRKLR